MAQLRHGLLILVLLVLSGVVASCQLLFPRPLGITASGPAPGRYASASGLSTWVEFSAGVPHGNAEKGIVLKENGSTMAVRYLWSGNRVTLSPDKGLAAGNRYDLTVASTVEDDQGTDLGWDFVLTFYTRLDDVRPLATITAPTNGAAAVTLFQPTTIIFSRAVDRASFYSNLTVSPSFKAAYTWGAGDLSCVVTPLEALKSPSVYTIKVGSATSDTQGNTLGTDVSIWFSTGTVGLGPTPSGVVITVLNVGPGTYVPITPLVTLSPVNPSGTVTSDSGFERTWGLQVTFDKPVVRSGLDSLITVEPSWSFSIPYTAATVLTAQLIPGAPLVWGTVYTLTVHKGVTDADGNPSTADSVYRFKVDGPGSAPPKLQAIAFHTNLANPDTNTILGDHTTDFTTIDASAFNTTASTYLDLTFTLATGADIDLASVMSHFSISATDSSTVAAITAVGPRTVVDPTRQSVRVNFQLTRGGSGILTFKLSAGLADSLGNATAADESWPVLE